jgi:hypothetical protein
VCAQIKPPNRRCVRAILRLTCVSRTEKMQRIDIHYEIATENCMNILRESCPILTGKTHRTCSFPYFQELDQIFMAVMMHLVGRAFDHLLISLVKY